MSNDPNLPEPDFIQITEDYLIVNKSAGVLTQAPPGVDSIELRIRQWKAKQTGEPHPYVGVPHRLDRPVSGIMVFGQTPKATRRLGEQFQSREVKKFYWAIVSGNVPDDLGTWTDFMRKVPDAPRSEVVGADHPDAQIAILNFRVLGRTYEHTWLRIDLETGRTHQIRLQCANRGYPVVGDDLYGSLELFGPQTVDLRARTIALHSRRLTFYEHRNRRTVDFTAQVPPSWQDPLSNFPEFVEMD